MAVQIGGMPPPPLPTTRTTTVSVGVSAPRAPIATASTTVVLAPPPESEPVSTFFDAPVFAAPAGVVFVLDRSGSMNDALRSPHETRPMGRSFRHASKLQRAKQELLAALADLPDGTRVNVVFFSGSSRAFRADPITLDALSRRGLDATVAHTVAGGRTDLSPTHLIAHSPCGRRRWCCSPMGATRTGWDQCRRPSSATAPRAPASTRSRSARCMIGSCSKR
jgi:hypothetical protein